MATYPFPIRLDHMVEVCGSYSAPDTTFTLPYNPTAAGVNAIVLSSAFGADAGTIITTGLSLGSTDVVVTGDYSAGRVMIGRTYDMELELTPPFLRLQDNNAMLRTDLRVQRVVVRHQVAGDYEIVGARDDRTSQGTTFAATAKTVDDDGEHKSQIRGLAEKTTVTLKATGPRPTTLVQALYHYRPTLK